MSLGLTVKLFARQSKFRRSKSLHLGDLDRFGSGDPKTEADRDDSQERDSANDPLYILRKSKGSKLANPLTDRKFEWLKLGGKDATTK